jgi:NDP-sugar pyrophosphorylase family protein
VGTQCVILAGGLGTRMRPLTPAIPKALIVVRGEPFIDHQLRWLAAHGIEEVVLCIGHRGGQLREHLGDRRFGIPLRYVDEGENLRGTAGAVRLAFDEGVLDESFLLTYGDSYLPVDFGAFASAFTCSADPAMMAVFRNEGRWDTSNVIVSGGRVSLYDKKRRDPAATSRMLHIDYGLLAFRRSVVEQRIAPGLPSDLADLLHALSLEGQLAAYEVETRFFEIGSPEGLRDLEHFLTVVDRSRPPA